MNNGKVSKAGTFDPFEDDVAARAYELVVEGLATKRAQAFGDHASVSAAMEAFAVEYDPARERPLLRPVERRLRPTA